MKMNLNAKTHFTILLVLTLFLGLSCSNDKIDSNVGKLNLSAKSTFNNITANEMKQTSETFLNQKGCAKVLICR